MKRRPWACILGVFGALFLWPRPQFGYSVQTHEQLVDLVWKPAIVPLLLSRSPGLTEAQLAQAHAYAYGGCAIQDIGYYPFGKPFFSNLTHYVRTGDFVRSLLRNAGTPDELAFAVGALSHYVGDTAGHALAVNPSVAAEFPRLRAKYGKSVSYEDDPHAHVRTEFAFDINEIAKHRFAPTRYLEHVGLEVATNLLAKSFFETYGLRLESITGRREKNAVRSYRFAVRHLLPRVAYAETVLHRHAMPPDTPDAELRTLETALAQSGLENGWESFRGHPGIRTYSLAGLIFVLPKFGPLSILKIKGPEPATEEAYVKSVNVSTATMRRVLGELAQTNPAALGSRLPNRDLDTGMLVRPGAYRLTDETYATLLEQITRPGADKVPSGLQRDLVAYYADPQAPIATKNHPERWARVGAQLAKLKTMDTVPEP